MIDRDRTLARFRRGFAVAILAALLALVLYLVWSPAGGRAPGPALLIALRPLPPDGNGGGSALLRLPLAGSGHGGGERLLEGFEVAGAPQASFDGGRVLFSGRRKAADPLEIWELASPGAAPRRLARGGDCLEPCYLPGGRFAFARAPGGPEAAAASSLYTAGLDGGGERRITFGTAADRSPALLPDGRLVFRRGPVDSGGPGALLAVNPDGAGLQFFLGPEAGAAIVAGPWTMGDRVLFAEEHPSDPAGEGGPEAPGRCRLVAVEAARPLAGRRAVEAPAGSARFTSVAELDGDRLIAASALGPAGSALFEARLPDGALAPWELPGTLLQGLEAGSRPLAVAVAAAAPRRRPLELTSVVDETKRTGTLLCVDVHNSRLAAVAQAARGRIRSVRVLLDGGQLAGEAPVQADGSFFIEVPADRPLRLELIGSGGVIAEDAAMFWVRPNENRGCVGCHEDPELVPENQAPLAVGLVGAPEAAGRPRDSLSAHPLPAVETARTVRGGS